MPGVRRAYAWQPIMRRFFAKFSRLGPGGNDRPEAPSGTDRVAEVARGLTDVDIIVNVQGDEPELAGESIDLVIKLLEDNPTAVMATLATPIRSRSQWEDPACVKVVFDRRGRALYFSRSPIPYPRQWDEGLFSSDPPVFYQHVGLYAYRRDFLLKLAAMPPSPLEKLEKLEQLRVLEAGYSIIVGVVDEPTFGIDTPEDYRSICGKVLFPVTVVKFLAIARPEVLYSRYTVSTSTDIVSFTGWSLLISWSILSRVAAMRVSLATLDIDLSLGSLTM